MLTLKRLGVYLLTFFIVVSLLIGFVNWKWLDKYLVSKANKSSNSENSLYEGIAFVQLNRPKSGSEGETLKLFRQRIVKLLNTIARESKDKRGPSGVVLDIMFSNDETELENLKAALKQLKDLNIPVYATYNPYASDEGNDLNIIKFEDIEAKHESNLYNDYLTGTKGNLPGNGRYHTLFYPENNVANYENDIYLKSYGGDSVLIESLVRRVAIGLGKSKSINNNPKRVGSIVPIRSLTEIKNKTYTFVPDTIFSTGIFQPPTGVADSIDMNKNILIVGDVFTDLVHLGNNKIIPGPYLVSWALSDLLNGNSNLKLPLENLSVIIGQLLFFSLLTVLIFALLFKYVKRLQTNPAIISILAFIMTMLFFFIYGKLILGFNYVIPAGHTIVASIVAAFLCWRFAHKFLVTGVAEGSRKYDVFISYSRSQSDWVEKNVYEPLAAFRKPNGDKLNIFYDKKSIGIGEAFTSKYMWAIVDSKYFVPILSDDYYGKNHCRNEIDLAYKRQVEKLLEFKMIAFSDAVVPEIYKHINYLERTRNPDFIKVIEDTFAGK